MMGGGFGGSTIQLVHNSILDEFVSYFEGENNAYQKETNISPSVIVTKLSRGSKIYLGSFCTLALLADPVILYLRRKE